MSAAPLRWRDRRRIFSIRDGGAPAWMQSHVQNPCPVVLGDRVRVFVNSRPSRPGAGTVSLPGYVDLDSADLGCVIGVSPAPVMDLGGRGCFDEHGCMSSSVLIVGSELWMYYVGWRRGSSVPYNWCIGLATSTDGGRTFRRRFRGPVVGPSLDEPFLQNGCQVLRRAPDDWWMFYSTGRAWLPVGDKWESRYDLTVARSTDGVNWLRSGAPIIPAAHEDETQTTPALFPVDGGTGMLFSTRHSVDFRNAARGYRLGFAWSDDLVRWHRDDARGGLVPGPNGWDAEMTCYPHVFQHRGQSILLYAGNGFGADAFGMAVLDRPEHRSRA